MSHPTELESAENHILENKSPDTSSAPPPIEEKSIFNDPIFYATLIVVGIAGFFVTRKAQNNIQRNRLRAARRFKGTDFTPQNGELDWEEDEVGLGI